MKDINLQRGQVWESEHKRFHRIVLDVGKYLVTKIIKGECAVGEIDQYELPLGKNHPCHRLVSGPGSKAPELCDRCKDTYYANCTCRHQPKEGLKPMKYRKKPIVIEAIKYQAEYGNNRIMNWLALHGADISGWLFHDGEITIQTLEGEMLCSDGDFIIKGIKGEFYPCKPDIFEETYEELR